MNMSEDRSCDATESARPFQFALRQLLGAVAVASLAAAIVAWRDIRLSYVPEAFALIVLGVGAWALLTRRRNTFVASCVLLIAFLVRLVSNAPVANNYPGRVLASAPVRVQVVDMSLKPIAVAEVKLESEIKPSSIVSSAQTDEAGEGTVNGYYFETTRIASRVYGYGTGRQYGYASLFVSAPGYAPAERRIEVPTVKEVVVVKLRKR